ncbi:PLP-dependent aminotransferase family protein [Psychromonas sp. 14N.309.X.WAT.B.A12]|uniref:MocR-like pyridoxine biosynthesis transcription factor PdxR n=1 Tax=Psychromonas sp. 14N.309.X.WAT.B.A12 TaxID=2998322 RepID=UPI0025AF4492|nr:PLP-dependent aminotransferase family protein [Psychromonas sp. 14N.309.X.WAT.B.A12]MDN2664114.1 PLP-dependent aminotransferase family protein [Psychromonas sp. 14N.309.X.WAT.B.A12]
MFGVEIVARYIQIDRQSPTPLFLQAKKGLEQAILEGHFQSIKLPSTRNLSEQLNVSLNTVLMAYEELEAQGIIYSKARLGRYVNPEIATQESLKTVLKENTRHQGWMKRAKSTATPGNPVQLQRSAVDAELPFPFITASIPEDSFPSAAWIKASREALQAGSRKFSLYDNFGADDPVLIDIILKELLVSRGIKANAENIILTVGTQHALFLISELLIKKGTPVAVEEPGYPDARHAFLRAGANICPVPVDDSGIHLESIPNNTEIIYTTPSHQLPSNISMSMPRKAGLLQKAKQIDSCIIEDDYDAEMRFIGRSSPPIASQGLDNVIYISGFSKYLGAVCRIAYIIAHKDIISSLLDIRRYQLRNLSGHEQRTLAHFIANGGYDQQIRNLRKVAKKRWKLCQKLIKELLPEWKFTTSTGGLNLWVEVPADINTTVLASHLRKQGVVIEPGPVFFSQHEQGNNFIKLGFILLNEEQLREGLTKIAIYINSSRLNK